MKVTTLELIGPLLEVLRANPALHEAQPACFHLDGRDFLHFHDDADGVHADVRLSQGFVRMPVGTRTEQAMLLDRVDEKLGALENHVRDRQRRGSRTKLARGLTR